MSNELKLGPSDYLAAERTFLAWIRTGLALMGLGFVLARFAIFLREFRINQPAPNAPSYGLSLWFGTALILVGVMVCVLSLLRYRRLLRPAERPEDLFAQPSRLAIAIALVLAALGLAMAIYLVTVRADAKNNLSTPWEESMSSIPESGIVRIPSKQSVDATVKKLESLLQAKGVKVFAIVDHSGEAATVGLKMPSTKLLIFGNPKAGTPLMLASPSAALDLPLKILVAEDAAGKAWISYNAPGYLQKRHNLPPELLPNVAVIEALAAKAAE